MEMPNHFQNNRPFLEIKHRLDGSIERFECLAIQVTANEAVVVYEVPQDVQLNDFVVPSGTLSFGYFWRDRNYNVYHWVPEAGKTLGIYFNICHETTIDEDFISWKDLIIDLLATPDGRCRVLDIGEVPRSLDKGLIHLIKETAKHLQGHYRSVIAEVEKRTAGFLNTEVKGG